MKAKEFVMRYRVFKLSLTFMVICVATAAGQEVGKKVGLPNSAQNLIIDSVEKVSSARKVYRNEVEKVRQKLLADLERLLQTETKQGHLDSALAIRSEVEKLKSVDFLFAVEDVLGNSDLLKETERKLIGVWEWTFVNTETLGVTQYEFSISSHGKYTAKRKGTGDTSKGTWRLEPMKARILFTDDVDSAWNTLKLPLNQDRAIGETYNGPQWNVLARKRKEPMK